jgi:hypothetical protein
MVPMAAGEGKFLPLKLEADANGVRLSLPGDDPQLSLQVSVVVREVAGKQVLYVETDGDELELAIVDGYLAKAATAKADLDPRLLPAVLDEVNSLTQTDLPDCSDDWLATEAMSRACKKTGITVKGSQAFYAALSVVQGFRGRNAKKTSERDETGRD